MSFWSEKSPLRIFLNKPTDLLENKTDGWEEWRKKATVCAGHAGSEMEPLSTPSRGFPARRQTCYFAWARILLTSQLISAPTRTMKLVMYNQSMRITNAPSAP